MCCGQWHTHIQWVSSGWLSEEGESQADTWGDQKPLQGRVCEKALRADSLRTSRKQEGGGRVQVDARGPCAVKVRAS